MDYKLVTLEEKAVRGLAIRTENADGKAARDIGAVWKRFFGEGIAAKIQNRANRNCVGLYTEYEGDYTKPYTYIAGCEAETMDGGLAAGTIFAGKYAVFTARGDLAKSVGEAWEAVWASGLDRVYRSDFEEYLCEDGGARPSEIRIYIGIR